MYKPYFQQYKNWLTSYANERCCASCVYFDEIVADANCKPSITINDAMIASSAMAYATPEEFDEILELDQKYESRRLGIALALVHNAMYTQWLGIAIERMVIHEPDEYKAVDNWWAIQTAFDIAKQLGRILAIDPVTLSNATSRVIQVEYKNYQGEFTFDH